MDVPEIPAGAGLPRDVWDAADEAVEAIVASIWQSEADGVQISWGEARMAVGRAILAERERCAEIAERFPGAVLHFSDRPYDKPSEYRAATSADIAKAIRS